MEKNWGAIKKKIKKNNNLTSNKNIQPPPPNNKNKVRINATRKNKNNLNGCDIIVN